MPDPVIQAIRGSAEFKIDPVVTDAPQPAAGSSAASFGKALGHAVEQLANTQQVADDQAQKLALGQTTDVASVAMGVERANLAMQLAVQVRNKAVDAYHEIFRMQI